MSRAKARIRSLAALGLLYHWVVFTVLQFVCHMFSSASGAPTVCRLPNKCKGKEYDLFGKWDMHGYKNGLDTPPKFL